MKFETKLRRQDQQVEIWGTFGSDNKSKYLLATCPSDAEAYHIVAALNLWAQQLPTPGQQVSIPANSSSHDPLIMYGVVKSLELVAGTNRSFKLACNIVRNDGLCNSLGLDEIVKLGLPPNPEAVPIVDVAAAQSDKKPKKLSLAEARKQYIASLGDLSNKPEQYRLVVFSNLLSIAQPYIEEKKESANIIRLLNLICSTPNGKLERAKLFQLMKDDVSITTERSVSVLVGTVRKLLMKAGVFRPKNNPVISVKADTPPIVVVDIDFAMLYRQQPAFVQLSLQPDNEDKPSDNVPQTL